MPSWPDGVITTQLVFGKGITPGGNLTSARLAVEIVLNGTSAITWEADGTPILPFVETASADEGAYGATTLPVVDQTGWLDSGQHPYTMWGYKLTETPTYGRTTGTPRIKYWQPVTGQTTIDFDRIPDGSLGLPLAGPLAVVTSVNGLTGAVTLIGGGGGGTSDYNQLINKPDIAGQVAASTAYSVQRANHTGTQTADTITDGTTNKVYTATDRTKLAGITAGATANRTDSATDTAIQSAVNNLINGAPGALDTITELAAALGNDPNAISTLTNAIAGKVPTSRLVAGKPLSADVTVTKGDVGLANVDNTTDTAKPISVAQQSALDLKAPLASPTFTGTVSGITATMVGADPAGTSAAAHLATKSQLLRITAKGDSITLGGEDGTGISWPDLLQRAIGPGATVINNGQGGYTSTEVGITDGAIDVTVAAFTIPASTAATTVTVTAPAGDFITGPSGITYTWTGTLAGVTGTLKHDVSTGSAWTFTATTAPGAPVSVPAGSKFHCTQNDDKTSNLAIIAVGRNNYQNAATIVADINAMIARLSSSVKRYLVLGVTTQVSETTGTGGNTAVLATNTALAAAFGTQYIDVRGYLIGSGLTFNGITPSTADSNAITNGTIPPALMHTDGLHPNRYGYRAMAKAVLDRLVQLGWTTQTPSPIQTTAPTNIYPEPGFEGGRAIGMTTNLGVNGTMTAHLLAARTGMYGLRAAIAGTVTNPQVVVNVQLLAADANIAHSASIWVRPSKTITVTPFTNYFDAGYSYLIGDTGTAQSCTAGVWTKVVIPVGNVPTAAGNYQLVVQANGSFAAGDIIDFDDVQVVAGGTTTPDPVTSVAGRNGDVVLTKTDVGLANVTNTADASKPVSTAQATAIAAAQAQVAGVNTQTASYTTVLADAGKLVVANSTSAVTFTIPTNATVAYPVGTLIALASINTGALTIAGASGVTVNSPAGLRLTTQYAQASLVKIGTDTWLLSGQTVA